jgi:hypothetical protein
MNKNTVPNAFAWIILAIIVMGFIGTALIVTLKIVGIEYESRKQLIIFVVVVFLLSIPIDLFVNALPKALYTVGKINKESINLILYPLDFIGNLVAVSIPNYFMDSVKLSFLSMCIFSIILCTISYLLDKKAVPN